VRPAYSDISIFGICEDVRHFSQHSYNVTINSHNGQLTLHTDSHASDSGAVRRDGWTILGAKSKLLYSEIALSRKPFEIGHIHIYTLLLRITDTMTSQNTDHSSGTFCIHEGKYIICLISVVTAIIVVSIGFG
jgi:hypothetical protein